MKKGFYPKLALDGMRKNKRLYIPYILTCIGMVMLYYIILFLQYSKTTKYLPGADTLRAMLGLGGWVIAIFANIFLFYTNSFLMRRRKKEFGLYNILGMNKRNISRILFWEYIIITVVSIATGLVAGIVLSKLAELGLVNVLKSEVTYSMSISGKAIIMTVEVFAAIFILLFLNGIRGIKFANAIALMRSENVGEKPPKGNWFFGIIGILLLGTAYYITITIQDPVSALVYFFLAVVLVIIGTYLTFISGSVLFCRILQKKKKYYYKANHFVSVSSMVYRMKRNGAGLASICILATMVLVMLSSTTDLYFGAEDSINTRYPKAINIEIEMDSAKNLTNENIDIVRSVVEKKMKEYHVTTSNLLEYKTISFAGVKDGDAINIGTEYINSLSLAENSNLCQVFLMTLEDYNRIMKTQESLKDNEVMVYAFRTDYKEGSLSIEGSKTFTVKKHLTSFIGSGDAAMNIIPSIYVVMKDISAGCSGLEDRLDKFGNSILNPDWTYECNTNLDGDKEAELAKAIRADLRKISESKDAKVICYYCDSREENRTDFYNTFGSLFFLGIILSIVFIFAAVLIIYYKQISEGYEDQARFEIMQKVGMTKKEIRKSINSQLLTVFFLPLVGAGVHLAFAFPIIQKLLLIFNLDNVALFALTTGISFLAFALFYTMVYRITSNAYYNIVSGVKE